MVSMEEEETGNVTCVSWIVDRSLHVLVLVVMQWVNVVKVVVRLVWCLWQFVGQGWYVVLR